MLINETLRTAYDQALANSVIDLAAGDSRPHLISIPPAYLQATAKLMIVGQETFGWAEDKPVEAAALMQAYSEWDLAAHYPRTPFWSAAFELERRLNPSGPDRSFLWSNLVKVDVGRRRPSAEVEKAVAALDLLPLEIRVAQPDVVVFFTGPNYDSRLLATFPGTEFTSVGDYTLRACARVNHPLLPAASFRTYHPRFLRLRRAWGVIEVIAAEAHRCRLAAA